jgi:hypothetical protein
MLILGSLVAESSFRPFSRDFIQYTTPLVYAVDLPYRIHDNVQFVFLSSQNSGCPHRKASSKIRPADSVLVKLTPYVHFKAP